MAASRGIASQTCRHSCSTAIALNRPAAGYSLNWHRLVPLVAPTAVQYAGGLRGHNQLLRSSRRSCARLKVAAAADAASSSLSDRPASRGRFNSRQQGHNADRDLRGLPRGSSKDYKGHNSQNRTNNGDSINHKSASSSQVDRTAGTKQSQRHIRNSNYTSRGPRNNVDSSWNGKLNGLILSGQTLDPPLLTTAIKQCQQIEQLQLLVDRYSKDMNHIHLAAAIVHLAGMKPQAGAQQDSRQLLQQLWQLQQSQLPKCSFRELGNMIHALCLLPLELQQHYQQAVMTQLLPAFMQQLQQANPQAVANVLYAVAKSGAQLEARHIQQLLGQLVSGLTTAAPQAIANAVWAVATMDQQVQSELIQQLLEAFANMGHTAKPQAFANILWAVATMGQQVQPHMLQQLLRGFASTAHTAKPQNISNILWAVATMGQQLKAALLQQMLDALVDMSHQANLQAISNTLWAVSTMQHTIVEGQLQQLLRTFVSKLGQADPQHVSNTLLACARFGYLPENLLSAPQLLSKLLADTPQGLANAAWACGELGYREHELIAAIIKQAVSYIEGVSIVEGRDAGFKVQELCNMCWAVAVLDLQPQAAMVPLLTRACQRDWSAMVPEGHRQLYQVHLWLLDHQLAGGQGLLGALTEQQLQQCKAAWDGQMLLRSSAVASDFQRSVFTTVQQLYSSGKLKLLEPPRMEQVSLGRDGQPDGAALIDITARTADGVMLAIEADGPTHFRRPDGGLMGTTQYRNRALAVRGYTVVSIPYYEWPWGSKQAQEDYLLQQIQVATKAQPQQQQRLQAELGTPAWVHKPAHGGQLGTKASSSTAVGNGSNNSSRVRRIRRRS